MKNDNLKQFFTDLASQVDTKNQIEDFVAAFAKVVDIFNAMKADSAKDRQSHGLQLTAAIQQLQDDFAALKATVKDGLNGKDGMNGLDGLNADVEEVILEVLSRIQLPEQKDILLDGPAEIVTKLQSLEGDNRLDISAIKGIDDKISALEKLVAQKNVIVPSPGARELVKAYDLSPSLNGVTKTFNLPAMWRLISVQSSSFPYTFRYTTDYTWTPQSITFTSEIDASTVLASGQTITLIYVEA